MRSIYSELILKPSLIICVLSTLNGCTDKAFQSAVYTDPDRLKHAKSSAADTDTVKDAKSNKARLDKLLKGHKESKNSPAPVNDPVADDQVPDPVVPKVIPSPKSVTTPETNEFETRRSRSRKAVTISEDSSDVKNTKKDSSKKSAKEDSAKKTTLQLNFTTESVDGLSPTAVLKSLVSVSNQSSDSTQNLETLNQGSFRIELSSRDDTIDRYDAIAALTFQVTVESDDPNLDSNEVTKTLRLTNLGPVFKTSSGYEALLKFESKRFLRVKIHAKDGKKPRSGEVLLIQSNGSETKILTLIQES